MVEINNDARSTYKSNSQMKFKTEMIRSSFCDYGDPLIFVKRTMNVVGAGANDAIKAAYRNKK